MKDDDTKNPFEELKKQFNDILNNNPDLSEKISRIIQKIHSYRQSY